jgi:3-phenylpropionate/trans-cinnamate dioxygenase ferredoxin reductase subunit
MNVNLWDVTDPIQRLIGERVVIDDRRLADPGIAIDDLAPSREGATS